MKEMNGVIKHDLNSNMNKTNTLIPSRPLVLKKNVEYMSTIVIQVKQLKRQDALQVQLHELDYIYTLKLHLSKSLSIPVSDMKLLFKGKACFDYKTLLDYSIASGATLNLFISSSSSSSESASATRDINDANDVMPVDLTKNTRPVNTKEIISKQSTNVDFWLELQDLLQKHFQEASPVVLNHFKQSLNSLL
jgi:hypothetical protein